MAAQTLAAAAGASAARPCPLLLLHAVPKLASACELAVGLAMGQQPPMCCRSVALQRVVPCPLHSGAHTCTPEQEWMTRRSDALACMLCPPPPGGATSAIVDAEIVAVERGEGAVRCARELLARMPCSPWPAHASVLCEQQGRGCMGGVPCPPSRRLQMDRRVGEHPLSRYMGTATRAGHPYALQRDHLHPVLPAGCVPSRSCPLASAQMWRRAPSRVRLGVSCPPQCRCSARMRQGEDQLAPTLRSACCSQPVLPPVHAARCSARMRLRL